MIVQVPQFHVLEPINPPVLAMWMPTIKEEDSRDLEACETSRSLTFKEEDSRDLEACETSRSLTSWEASSAQEFDCCECIDEKKLPSRRTKRRVGTMLACLLLVLLLLAVAMILGVALLRVGSAAPAESSPMPSSHSKRQRLGANDSQQQKEEDLIRVQVSYNTQRGKRLAAACAESIIENDNANSSLLILATRTCLDQLYLEESDIDSIEEDHPVEGQSVFDVPSMSRGTLEVIPWGISMIQADSVEMGSDANETIVCIADSGIELNHPDFDPDYITGEDAVLRTGQVWKWNEDKSGHGTHIAGIIAATQNNDIGVTGAAGRIRLHIVRALDDQAQGYESDMRRAINSCVDAGAKIINLSLGMSNISSTTEDLLNHVVDDLGKIVIAASGNSGTTQKFYPAAHPKVISVGAVKDDGERWSGSTMNDQLELSAPGQKVLSTTVSSSAVQTVGFEHAAKYLEGSSHVSVTGTLKDCGNGSNQCPRNRNGICLLRLESENSVVLDMMLENCAKSRAQGAIIYKAAGNSYGTWVQHTTLSAVVVQRSVGEVLIKDNLGEKVTIGDVDGDNVEYTYSEMTGTSMAAPHVAAAAALIWSHFGTSCSNHQIRYALAHSAVHPNNNAVTSGENQKCDSMYGHGVVKVQDAFNFLSTHDCSTWDVALLSQGGCTTTSVVV